MGVKRRILIVVQNLGREDVAFTLIGSGDCFEDLVALRYELGARVGLRFAVERVPVSAAGREDYARQIWQQLTLEPWYRNVRSLGMAA